MTLRTWWMSWGERTKDSATASTPDFKPNIRSSRSFSVTAAISNSAPGKLTPLCGFRMPPRITRVSTRSLDTEITASSRLPSSSRIRPPGVTAWVNLGKSTETISWFPNCGLVVRNSLSPAVNTTASFSSSPVRIFGPCKSCKMVTGLFCIAEAERSFLIVARWSSWLPCEKFKRATSIPAIIKRCMVSSSWLAGPKVATIRAKRSLNSDFRRSVSRAILISYQALIILYIV